MKTNQELFFAAVNKIIENYSKNNISLNLEIFSTSNLIIFNNENLFFVDIKNKEINITLANINYFTNEEILDLYIEFLKKENINIFSTENVNKYYAEKSNIYYIDDNEMIVLCLCFDINTISPDTNIITVDAFEIFDKYNKQKIDLSKLNNLIEINMFNSETNNDAFNYITDIDIKSCQTFKERLFYNFTRLSNINIPDNLEEMYDYCFYNCKNLESIDLSKTQISSIRYRTFNKCINLSSISFPKSLYKIDNEAFMDCSSLISIDLQNTKISSIGENAFYGCYNLQLIKFPNINYQINKNAFSNCPLSILNIN